MSDFLDRTRSSYDRIAEQYAEHIFDKLNDKLLDRARLDRFAELVKPLGVAVDLGCGPGQIARYLHNKGVPVSRRTRALSRYRASKPSRLYSRPRQTETRT